MRPDAYTPAEDAAIRAGVAAGTPYRRIAAHLRRSRSGVMRRAAWLTAHPPEPEAQAVHPIRWTEAQRDHLRAWWGLRPDRQVAADLARLGPPRTVRACEEQAWRLGQARRANVLTLAEAARVFGVQWKVARRWIDRGLLGARRTRIRKTTGWLWHVPGAALRRFVREHLHPYDLARMAPGHWLTDYARQVLGGDGGAWLTLQEAAREVHFAWNTIWSWVDQGRVPGRSRTRHGPGLPLVVRRGDLLAAAAAHEALWRARQAAANRRRAD